MPQYGIILASPANRDLDAFTFRQLALFAGARDELLSDPTTTNIFVTDLDGVGPYGAGDFALIWGDITVLFRFVHPTVIEIFAVLAEDRTE